MFLKSPGMTLAPDSSSPLMRVTRRLMAHRVSATTPPSAHSCKLRLRGEAAPANARPVVLRSLAWSAELVRAGRSLPGNPSSAIPTTASAIRRTFLSSLQTDSGVTTTFSAGRTPPRAARRAAPTPAPGPARGELLSLRQSWRAFRRSSTRRPVDRKAIPLPSITSLRPRSTVRAEAVPATPTTGMPLAQAAFFTM